jgi:heat shock protein HtpX
VLAARNIAKVLLLLGGLVAVLTALGWWIGELAGASAFFAVALVIAVALYWYGPRIVLTSFDAREVTLIEAPRFVLAAQRLAADAGLPAPRTYLLDDAYPVALSVGRGPGDLAIAVSRGVLALSGEAELDGLIAHELAHGRHRDVTIQTPTVLLALWLLEASRLGGRLSRALLFVFAPIAASLVAALLSPRRDLAADRWAVALCGSPHGLADALARLDQAMELVDFRGASPATEPLYAVSPFGHDRLAAMFSSHPTVDDRVRRLRSLDPDWSDRLHRP